MKRILALSLMLCLLCGCAQASTDVPTTASIPSVPTDPTVPTTVPTEPTQPDLTGEFLLSFAGDCTFGGNYTYTASSWNTFDKVVGTNYAHPFENVKYLFEADDYTFVNLEGTLTTYDPTQEDMKECWLINKPFRFRGTPEYVNILTQGSAEFASIANNHILDYAKQGMIDTQNALTAAGVAWASWDQTALVTTESGLTIGVYANSYAFRNDPPEDPEAHLVAGIQALKAQGAEVIIASLHWGIESKYTPDSTQKELAHAAIDAGANIVYGHHTHTLQPVESYNGGMIYYSLGNFSFGGNRNPNDKDTAVIQQKILRAADGTVTLGETILIPCRLSSVTDRNDYRPTPYEEGSSAYQRCMKKLQGTYK